MDKWIDGYGNIFWVDVDAIPRMSTSDFLRLYAETGLIFFDGNPPPVPPIKITFETYYQQNKKQ